LYILLVFASEDQRDTFEYVYNKYKNLLLHKAYEILRDRMLAEDAVSEAFLRIYKNIHKIDDPDSGRCAAFVVTIAKNAALTLLSREKKNAYAEYDEEQSDGFDLEQHVVSEMTADNIYAVIGGVDEELRSVFLMSCAYGLSNGEIAKLLKLSVNNVAVRLHRAKRKITAILAQEGYALERR